MPFPQLLINYFKKSFTISKTAVKISSYEEDYRIQGFQFVHMDKDIFPNGTSYFVFDPTPLKDTNIHPFTLPLIIDVPEGPITFTVYKNTDYVGTVPLLYYNPEQINNPSPLSTVKGVASGSDKGTKLYSLAAGASSTPAVINVQGSGRSSDPTVINPDYKYLVQVDNPTGAAVTANKVYFSWFEVPESDL